MRQPSAQWLGRAAGRGAHDREVRPLLDGYLARLRWRQSTANDGADSCPFNLYSVNLFPFDRLLWILFEKIFCRQDSLLEALEK
jgi:hypothetical protein